MTDRATHRASAALLGAYALGAVDEADRDGVERHLEACASCRHELSLLRAAATKLPAPPQPPDQLWQRIVATVRAAEREQASEHESDAG